MLFPASFKIALMCCSCMHHLLPWVTSYRIFHASCLVAHLVMFMCCVFTLLFASFRVVLLLDSSCFVAIVRIRSTTLGSSSSVHLLHGLVLLPSGISGKMTVTLDLTTIIAMLVASFYRYVALPILLFIKPPKLPCQPLTFFTLPRKLLLGYVTALLSPSYSVVSCRWSWRLLHDGHDYVGISQYLFFN